jgi:DNA-binding SARP family transcriptional activator
MEITVLGPLTVDGAGTLGRRDRVVLAVLVSRPGLQVAPDVLADATWGESPPASATKNLQGCVVRLRRLLGPEAIATSAFGYSFTLAPDDVDAWRFQRLVERARELLALGDPDRASYQLGQALALWRGEPFIDLEAWPPGAWRTCSPPARPWSAKHRCASSVGRCSPAPNTGPDSRPTRSVPFTT